MLYRKGQVTHKGDKMLDNILKGMRKIDYTLNKKKKRKQGKMQRLARLKQRQLKNA